MPKGNLEFSKSNNFLLAFGYVDFYEQLMNKRIDANETKEWIPIESKNKNQGPK